MIIEKQSTKTSSLYVPSTFNTHELLPSKEKKHVDKYNYLPDIIYKARKIDKRNTSSSFISISSKIFEQVVHARRATSIINFWLNSGVIECDYQYIVGEKSKGYRFTEDYRKVAVHQVPIRDYRFNSKMLQKKQRYLDSISSSSLIERFLKSNLMQVQIAAQEAMGFVHEYCKGKVNEEETFNAYYLTIHDLKDGNYFYLRDEVGYRVHNNFVTCPKELRPYLYLETGEQLVNLDVRNSQPLMLCVLLMQQYKHKDLPSDVAAYIKECEEGRFYEAFSTAAGIPIKDRKQFKQKLFKDVFFGNNKACQRSKAYKALSKYYPNVAAIITDIKKDDYTSLAIALQRVESEIIIDNVIGGLAADYHPEDFFALTIHDSICTTLSNQAELMKRMQEAFNTKGINVTINAEYFELAEYQKKAT